MRTNGLPKLNPTFSITASMWSDFSYPQMIILKKMLLHLTLSAKQERSVIRNSQLFMSIAERSPYSNIHTGCEDLDDRIVKAMDTV
jgi:hypothetical protein